MSLGASVSNSDGAVPMEVDRVEKGKSGGKKGKSKDGGKGKDKGKGKYKGKTFGEKGNQTGKGYGNNFQSSSWQNRKNSAQQTGWSGKSDSSSKGTKSGKGSKGKDSGKNNDQTCHRCGKFGHFARDCRVRLVGEDFSNQTETKTDKTTTHVNHVNNNSGSVNRVFLEPQPCTVFRQLDFDISNMDAGGSCNFTGLSVNMVSMDSCSAWQPSDAGEKGLNEFLHCGSVENVCNDVYRLHSLFKLDDFEHFASGVAERYGFQMYDVLHCDFMKLSCKHVNKFSEFVLGEFRRIARSSKCSSFDGFHVKPFASDVNVNRYNSSSDLHVRAVAASSHSDIVLDSGSDVTLLPIAMAGIGSPATLTPVTFLRDAQGKQILTSDVRDVTFIFQTTDGQSLRVKEKAFFSDKVDVPLLSFGKLIRAGWGIKSSGTDSSPILAHSSGSCVELSFRNNSLVVSGDIRMVQSVRAVSVDVPRSWHDLRTGWYTVNDFPICSSNAAHFIDVTTDYLVVDWPFRTTVAYHDIRGWEVIELCERIFPMAEKAAPIVEGGYQRLLTLLSKTELCISDFGMAVAEPVTSGGASGSASAANGAGDIAMGASSGAQEIQSDLQEVEVSVELPQSIAIQPRPDHVKIAGVDVSCTSAISVLKAACSYLQVSQSGSKSRLWSRILAALDKRAIEAERELAAVALDESQRKATSVQTAEPPEDAAVITTHNLTHMPYQPWCPACVMSKGRPEQHRSDPSLLQRREMPVISWDLCFSGKTCEAVEETDGQAKLTALVVHDSHSGAVQCIPIQSKKQTKFMGAEILRFINFLGYGDVTLRCDKEPTTLQVQRYVQRARQQLNLRTVVENSKVLDHGGNSAVEKAIDRVRLQASTFLHQLTQKIDFEVHPQHPIFAWAFVHSAWILTRFGVTAGVTPYELISGHNYNSKLCEFGCPVMVYVGDSVQQKTDAKWRKGIFLGKVLTNDMYLTSVAGTVKLTRSIKALFPAWQEHMEEYRQVTVFPWQLEGTLGNRIVPTLRSSSSGGVAIHALDDEMGEDPPDDADEPVPTTPIPDLIPVQPAVGMRPPPPTAVVSDPDGARPVAAAGGANETSNETPTPEGTEQAGLPAPSLGPPGPMTPLGMLAPAAMPSDMDVEEPTEPSAKRQKFSALRVGDETLFHMDVETGEYMEELGDSAVDFSCELDASDEMFDLEETSTRELTEDDLWRPFSQFEPELSSERLQVIDDFADMVEIQRLFGMSVLCKHGDYTGKLGTQLSAKFVRTWRKKTRLQHDVDGHVVSSQQGWLRRSRLVAREYNC
jgi:hypothetical protein